MSIRRDLADHPIRAFAIVCVAFIAVYVGYMAYRINEILSGPGWCRTALGADKATSSDGTVRGLEACVGLLTIQLKSLATNSHILFGVLAGCLLVLMVIVVAKGKVQFAASKDGASGTIGREADEAADQVAGAAVDKAEEIKGG